MTSFVEKLIGKREEEEDDERDDTAPPPRPARQYRHNHRKSRQPPRNETPAQTVPQLEKKVVTMKDYMEHEMDEKDALLKLVISGVQSLQDSLDVEKNERCDDVDELHSLCHKLRLAVDQEADARYEVDRSLEAFKEHSDHQDLEIRSDIGTLQEFQRETNEDKKIIMGAIMELEEKLNELKSLHGGQIDTLLANQNEIQQRMDEQILIIHRIQLSDFENAAKKIQDIQKKLQDQILTQAHDFRELTLEANKSMERQKREMTTVKRQIEDKIDELGGIVDQKEDGMILKLVESADRFDQIEKQFNEMVIRFRDVNEQVDVAINQIHSTRAKAEEATEIQKNRFDYFEMFMQTLKQTQATVDSRIGFLYTIVNELRWRERVSDGSYKVVKRERKDSGTITLPTNAESRSLYSNVSALGVADIDNITQTVNDIEMEVKARIEVISESLERHRKETLHALTIARDKSLASTTAVDKLSSVVEAMNEKFSVIQRLEKDISETREKQKLSDDRLAHLEKLNYNYNHKVDTIARKMWDIYDSDKNLPIFLDTYLHDDKERVWRLEYEVNQLKHMTVGDLEDTTTVPLHIQNVTTTGEVENINKSISRVLVKSENLVEDVTAIAKQNEMMRTDMRDLKLLCDYLISKNDETQRYCRALRKHLEYTNRKLEAHEKGNKTAFLFVDNKDNFEDDLPPLYEVKKKPSSNTNSPKPSPSILNLFMKNKERYTGTPESIEPIKLKSIKRSPAPIPAPIKSGNKKSSSPSSSDVSNAAAGFFSGLFDGDKRSTHESGDENKEPGLLERIFGGKKEGPAKNTGDQNNKGSSPNKKDRIGADAKISVDRGKMAEEQKIREKESNERLKNEREKELQRQEEIERALIEELEEAQARKKTEDERLKEKREKRLLEVTEKARRDRERSVGSKDRQYGYDMKAAEEERARRDQMIEDAKAARKKIEREELLRRKKAEEEEKKQRFDELSPHTLQNQKQSLSRRERIASGEVYVKQHDHMDRVREDLVTAEGFNVEVALPPKVPESSSEDSSESSETESSEEETTETQTETARSRDDGEAVPEVRGNSRRSSASSTGGKKKKSVFRRRA